MQNQLIIETPEIVVRRQTEIRSKNFGIYREGKLIEGGFFSKDAAEDSAQEYRAELLLLRRAALQG